MYFFSRCSRTRKESWTTQPPLGTVTIIILCYSLLLLNIFLIGSQAFLVLLRFENWVRHVILKIIGKIWNNITIWCVFDIMAILIFRLIFKPISLLFSSDSCQINGFCQPEDVFIFFCLNTKKNIQLVFIQRDSARNWICRLVHLQVISWNPANLKVINVAEAVCS